MLDEVLGFLIEYVLVALDVVAAAEPVVVPAALLVVAAALLVEDDWELVEDFEVVVLPTPTQYAFLTQKFVIQSSETSGFHLRKSACEILNSVSTVKQESPDLTVYHLLQFEAVFGCVGPEGWSSCPRTLMTRGKSRSVNKGAICKALNFKKRDTEEVAFENLQTLPSHRRAIPRPGIY